jgi:hypothetical protein
MFKCLLLRNYKSDWIQTRQECSLDGTLQSLGFLFRYKMEDGGHLWFLIGIINLIFVENLPMIIPGQFGFNCPSGFRKEAFWNIFPIGSNVKLSPAVAAIFPNCRWMIIGMFFTKFLFFYVDRKSKMAATAGHRLTTVFLLVVISFIMYNNGYLFNKYSKRAPLYNK